MLPNIVLIFTSIGHITRGTMATHAKDMIPAVTRGDCVTLREMLEDGHTLNIRQDTWQNMTPLMIASKQVIML